MTGLGRVVVCAVLWAVSTWVHAIEPIAADDDCSAAVSTYLTRLDAGADTAAEGCLVRQDAAGSEMLAALESGQSHRVRVARALALHRMQRLDREITAAEARALTAADRRLLRDGIQAHRGRGSPAEVHRRIFERYDWYTPDPTFTNARLTDLDRRNIAMLDAPPSPAAMEPAAAAFQAGPESVAEGASRCGCASGVGGRANWMYLFLVLVFTRMRGDLETA